MCEGAGCEGDGAGASSSRQPYWDHHLRTITVAPSHLCTCDKVPTHAIAPPPCHSRVRSDLGCNRFHTVTDVSTGGARERPLAAGAARRRRPPDQGGDGRRI